MKNPYLTERRLFPNKVDVDLDMLSAPVLNRIGSHVDSADIVTEDDGGCSDGVV